MQWQKPLWVSLAISAIMLASSSFADQRPSESVEMKAPRQERNAHEHQALPSQIFRASQLIDAAVENPQGEELGEIEDVVIDPVDGSVAYAVLEAGGFLGVGEKYYAIPWRALQAKVDNDGEMDAFILDVDKERLQNAMGFDKNNWPNMADPQWGEAVHAYYGQQDYWNQRQTAQHADSGSMTSQHAQVSQNQNAPTSVSATVENVRGNLVELQVPQGLVHDLQTGDRVEVNVQKQNDTRPNQSHQMQEKHDREELNRNTNSRK